MEESFNIKTENLEPNQISDMEMNSSTSECLESGQDDNNNHHSIKKLPGVTNFNWIIKEFEKKNKIFMRSHTFRIEGNPKMKWYLFLEKKKPACSSCELNFINVNLQNISLGNNFSSAVKMKMSLSSNFEEKTFTRSMKLTRIKLGATYTFYDSMKEEEFIKLTQPTGCLNVSLTVTPLKHINKSKSVNKTKTCSIIEKSFESFFNNTSLSDVTFKIQGRQFSVHRIILASVSSVFMKMFSSNETNTNLNVIEMNDVDPEVFKELLRFIYTGLVVDLESMVFGLYELAYKYNIPLLLSKCEKCLSNSLSIETVIYILQLANCHKSKNLKDKCIKYIDEHFEQVKKTEPFQTLERELLMDILCGTRTTKK
ncbi:protein roadkill-like [Leptopilina heterotoma]|uniref:protein roadkill-like n=1 Tax=Leptopilina heterotoma TaxID=63436 RepID=UPI001CA844F1|nr:protein roadkill-like [Leptopilina heterotoma]